MATPPPPDLLLLLLHTCCTSDVSPTEMRAGGGVAGESPKIHLLSLSEHLFNSMPWTGRKMPGLVGESPLLYNFLKQKQRNVPRNSLCPALNNPTVKGLDSSETFSPGPHSVRIDVFDVFCPTREFWPRWDAVVQSRQGTLGQHAGWSP